MQLLRTLPPTILVLFILLCGNAQAQAGANDPTFNPTDAGYLTGPNNPVQATAVQPDGKIIIGGYFTSFNATEINFIARLNADGSLDAGFDPGTGASSGIESTSVQADGKIIIAGEFTSYDGISRNHIARLNADGSLDTTFDPGAGANNVVTSTTLQPDGKILIVGTFTSFNGTTRHRIARLNVDGSLDIGFDPGTGPNYYVYAISLLSDGEIIIGGDFTAYNGTSCDRIVRLNQDGSLDTGFNPAGTTSAIHSIAVGSDGKIIIAGSFSSVNSTFYNHIARLNMDGSIDVGFIAGTGVNNNVNSAVLQPDGKIIIGGDFTNYDGISRNHIARLNADGSLDIDFNPGSGLNNIISFTELQDDGKILIAGSFTAYNGGERNYIARLNMNGNVDLPFNPGTGANSEITCIAVDSDGKILIGGYFHSYNGTGRGHIARLNWDGGLDTSFYPGAGTDGSVYSSAIQSDGKILVAGLFSSYNGIDRNCLARLNQDGSLDTDFDPGTESNSTIWSVAIQTDGKILIAGGFTTYGGYNRHYIARLNPDGSLDTGFDPGTGGNNFINSAIVLSDGKILIKGDFSNYNGVTRQRIARLNIDGSLDTGFNPGSGPNYAINSIAVQPDGKIIIGGEFSQYQGTLRRDIARLNADGGLDLSFDPGTGFDNPVQSLAIQSDGEILVGGDFISYNDVYCNHLTRLNSDGSLDTGFDSGTGTGANSSIYSIGIQSDLKILIGGVFNEYNGTGRNRIARVLSDLSVGKSETSSSDFRALHLWPNPNEGERLYLTLDGLDRSLRTVDAELFDATGRAVLMTTLTVTGGSINTSLNLGHADPGIYLLKLIAGNKTFSQRVVVDQ